MSRSTALFFLIAMTLWVSIQVWPAAAQAGTSQALDILAHRNAFWRHHRISRATTRNLPPDMLVRQQAYWDDQQRSRALNDVPGPP